MPGVSVCERKKRKMSACGKQLHGQVPQEKTLHKPYVRICKALTAYFQVQQAFFSRLGIE